MLTRQSLGIQKSWLQHRRYQVVGGFTLIEIVIVLLIIGIISINVFLSWPATSLNLEFEARRVLHDIRYAQVLSMVTGERYRWVRISATTYQITNESGVAMVLPSGGNAITLAHGAAFGVLANLPNNLIAFDSLGSPYVNTSYPGTALSATATIPITSGSLTRSIQISAQTGYGALV